MPTTIKQNIILDDKNYDRERLEQAIIDSGFDNYIDQSPLGIETEITKNHLSSGELQKLCITRAFYHGKSIMLWDEATFALDPAAEKHIVQALKRRVLQEDLIVIAVTHRLHFLTESNYVLYMRKNSSSIFGKHEELLNTCVGYVEMLSEEKDVKDDD